MATTITVTSATDSGTTAAGVTGGAGTLSDALAQANATTSPVVINITTDVSLTGPLSPILNPNVTIEGNGHATTSTANRIF